MPDPTGWTSHIPAFHRGVSWKQPCRVATTANITISTALNAGDVIDGVTLAAGDRVLVKSQSTGSQNGVYLAGVTPTRDFDMDQDGTTSVPVEEVMGAVIYIIAGTVNGGKTFRCTNTTAPTLGTTALVFTELTAVATPGALDDLTDVTITSPTTNDALVFNGSVWVNSTGHYELLMAAGSSPIEPLETGDGLDWLYVWVTA